MYQQTVSLIDGWENPPSTESGRRPRERERPWPLLAEELTQRPNEWARLATGLPTQSAYDINSGRLRDFRPAGSFEAVIRGQSIYVRYIGGGADR